MDQQKSWFLGAQTAKRKPPSWRQSTESSIYLISKAFSSSSFVVSRNRDGNSLRTYTNLLTPLEISSTIVVSYFVTRVNCPSRIEKKMRSAIHRNNHHISIPVYMVVIYQSANSVHGKRRDNTKWFSTWRMHPNCWMLWCLLSSQDEVSSAAGKCVTLRHIIYCWLY